MGPLSCFIQVHVLPYSGIIDCSFFILAWNFRKRLISLFKVGALPLLSLFVSWQFFDLKSKARPLCKLVLFGFRLLTASFLLITLSGIRIKYLFVIDPKEYLQTSTEALYVSHGMLKSRWIICPRCCLHKWTVRDYSPFCRTKTIMQ